MTKSKKVFAEMLVQQQGFGDAEEISKTMTLVDIIYELKKTEPPKEPEPQKEPEPPRDIWSRLSD